MNQVQTLDWLPVLPSEAFPLLLKYQWPLRAVLAVVCALAGYYYGRHEGDAVLVSRATKMQIDNAESLKVQHS